MLDIAILVALVAVMMLPGYCAAVLLFGLRARIDYLQCEMSYQRQLMMLLYSGEGPTDDDPDPEDMPVERDNVIAISERKAG